MTHKFTWGGYLLRLLGAVVLVLGTYNPDQWSYFHWVEPVVVGDVAFEVVMAFVGVVILIGWVIYIRATIRSLGVIGTILALAFFATLIWVLLAYTPLQADNVKLVTYLVLFGGAGVLSIGVSWSHVRRRLTGQLDVDETDD